MTETKGRVSRGRLVMRFAVLATATLVGGLLPVLDEPWLTNSWDWTFPGSIAVTLVVGILLGPPWAYPSPFLVVAAQHLVYLGALRMVSNPEIEHADGGFYTLAEILLVLVLIIVVWIGTAIRMVFDARRGRA